MTDQSKPTSEELDLIARFCEGVTHHYDEDRARVRRLLNAYRATQQPITIGPDAPREVGALPDFWDRRREQLGKGPSVCAAELREALEPKGSAAPADFNWDLFFVGSL